MKSPIEVIEELLTKNKLDQEMKEDEYKRAVLLLSTDLNQYILQELFTLLDDEKLLKVDELMKKDDQVGIIEIFDELGKDPNVLEYIEKSIANYKTTILKDLKEITKIIKKKRKDQ